MDYEHAPAGHQKRTVRLRRWFVDGDLDLDLNACYVIKHYIGEDETYYSDPKEDCPKNFYNFSEAETFAKHLNTKPEPETYIYLEWRE